MACALIRIRIDVDYPYTSRIRSFLYTALGIKTSRAYLENSKIIARMINESERDFRAYWFFTPKTIPDKELLKLIDNSKHEVALHIVNYPTHGIEKLGAENGEENQLLHHSWNSPLARQSYVETLEIQSPENSRWLSATVVSQVSHDWDRQPMLLVSC